MAQATMRIPARRVSARPSPRRCLSALSARYVEHREIRRWMRTNPPSVGRDSGARC